ncbi:MAG: hypothetical protein KGL42_14915 [Betaproteobacteria bacterium]|nr:hypothetical protein [Betaproteobacteria bacterium]
MSHGPTYYPSQGRCIYCGATDLQLSDEHIVPFSLGGQHVLKGASCLPCADVTKRFEQDVARSMWGEARAAFGERSRRKKARPSHIRMVAPETGAQGLDIPTPEFPAGMVFYKMGLPGALIGLPESVDTSPLWQLVMTGDHQRWMKFKERHGWGPVLKFQHEPVSFGRLLAKIGYCQALSELELGDFEATCLPYIMGQRANVSHIVGGTLKMAPARPGLSYELGTSLIGTQEKALVVAAVRLYANLGTPAYRVVVGEVSGRCEVRRVGSKIAPENVYVEPRSDQV